MCIIVSSKCFRRKHSGAGSSEVALPKQIRRGSTSYWTGIYNDNVRTASYNEFLLKVQIVASQAVQSKREDGTSCSSHIVDGILDPNQEKVESILQKEPASPEILKLAANYFENSRKASRLCGNLLESVQEARIQCRELERVLAGMPMSGDLEALFWQHSSTADGLQRVAEARNPFSEMQSSKRFEDCRGGYGALSRDVEQSRKGVQRRVSVVKCCRAGGIVIVVGVLAGATVIAVVVATHAVAGLAVVPVAGIVAPSRSKQKKTREVGEEQGESSHKMKCCSFIPPSRTFHAPCALQWLELKFWRKQSAQLEALRRGSFTEDRMLDTLRCLVDGLHEDLERNRRLIIFGWKHMDESLCLQQVAKQLIKSHLHLVQQLSNLEEQVVFCFMVINKTRDWVLQEFS